MSSHYLRPQAVAAGTAVVVSTLLGCASGGAPGGSAGRGPTPAGMAAAAGDTASVDVGDAKTIETLFAGRFPGVSVLRSDGGGLQIRIRGGSNSFMAGEEPLFVVDGSPLPAGTGGIVHLNPYDIETIEVLKNAPDIAIYGIRAANGVIRVTTIRPGRR